MPRKTSLVTLSNGKEIELNWPCEKIDYIEGPFTIPLPNGEEIVMDWIAYEGWGTLPGKRYTVIEVDDDNNIIWEKTWVIPPASQ